MWNFNIKQGAIWSTKSLNQYEDNYLGMKFGEHYLLILSAYIDENEVEKFTYLDIEKTKKDSVSLYRDININGTNYHICYDNICTGDRRALESFIKNVDEIDMKEIIDMLGFHFNFLKKPRKKQEQIAITDEKFNIKETVNNINKQIKTAQSLESVKPSNWDLIKNNKSRIHILKFGMEIEVEPSEDIQVNENGRLKFSNKFKEDIMNNDSEVICLKYNIYPIQAVNIIRSKLKYQLTHKN